MAHDPSDLPPPSPSSPAEPSLLDPLISALRARFLVDPRPDDPLQFCADFFNARLASERAHVAASAHPAASASASARRPAKRSAPGMSSAAIHSLAEEDEPTAPGAPPPPPSTSLPVRPKHAAMASSDAPFANFVGFNPSGRPSAPAPGLSTDDHPPVPSNYNLNRRTSVSAESLTPTSASQDSWTPPLHPKTPEQLERLRRAVSNNFLIAHLAEEQASQVLDALQERHIPKAGIKVISQGDVGDYFYVVESGAFDIFVNASGRLGPGVDGLGNRVATVGEGGSFGELALMYNAPRAATVVSTEPSMLWALDRVTFRRILMDAAFTRRRMYEGFLGEVPLLATLLPYERSKIADALEEVRFKAGATIIAEGEPGEDFFILESGTAEVYKNGEEGCLMTYKKGDYFGELALLNDAPRAASVVAKTDCTAAILGREPFSRLLGSLEGIMRRNDYSKHADVDPLDKS
jgi:cAMP-dependent protein kinase regulator